jgi:hypothetical protein
MKTEGRLRRPLNLWLDEDVDQLLEKERDRTGKSRTALINESIRQSYGRSGSAPGWEKPYRKMRAMVACNGGSNGAD